MSEDPAFVWNRPRRPSRPTPVAESAGADDPGPDSGAAVRGPDAVTDPGAVPSPPPPEVSERDAVLVPLDQWSRILNQLGNLHEAGQQLADARERAAKAETESAFLRERLKELRGRVEAMEEEAAAPPPDPEPEPSFGVWFLRRQLQRRRAR